MSAFMHYFKCLSVVLLCIILLGYTTLHKATGQEETVIEVVQVEQEVHQLINDYRISQNLSPLIAHEIITRQARMHSQAMETKKIPVDHSGFDQRVEIISQSLPLSAAAENIAYHKGDSHCVQEVTQNWLKSTAHRENIEGDYNLTGIGVAMDSHGACYITQIFWK
jgi:uncharacterized protein YkwD